MEIIRRLSDFASDRRPLVLTIGNFDGVHRGHCQLLSRCKELASPNGQSIALTFSNHPSTILRPLSPVLLLSAPEHKFKLMEENGVDTIILIPFTHSLARHDAARFIEKIRQAIPFSTLVLGHDARMGENREGDESMLTALALEWGFDVHYLTEYRYEGHVVSSAAIRQLLRIGRLDEVENRLGRPYSIYTTFSFNQANDLVTLEADAQGLCLPPDGAYPVFIKIDNRLIKGTAEIKMQPTSTLQVYLEAEEGRLLTERPLELIFIQVNR